MQSAELRIAACGGAVLAQRGDALVFYLQHGPHRIWARAPYLGFAIALVGLVIASEHIAIGLGVIAIGVAASVGPLAFTRARRRGPLAPTRVALVLDPASGFACAPDGRRLEELRFAGFSARWIVRRRSHKDSWGELSFGWKDAQLPLARVESREELEPVVAALRDRGFVVIVD